jgi:hypothetical protein
MRLKRANPSAAGSAAAIASMRAIAPATQTTGASGAGTPADMPVTIRSPSTPLTLPSRLPQPCQMHEERHVSAFSRQYQDWL